MSGNTHDLNSNDSEVHVMRINIMAVSENCDKPDLPKFQFEQPGHYIGHAVRMISKQSTKIYKIHVYV